MSEDRPGSTEHANQDLHDVGKPSRRDGSARRAPCWTGARGGQPVRQVRGPGRVPVSLGRLLCLALWRAVPCVVAEAVSLRARCRSW